jgi:hypothetical protein
MAFKGIFNAPKLTPTEFGLFSAAKPNDNLQASVDEKWVRGFETDFESSPNYVRVWDQTSAVSFTAFTAASAPYYAEIEPYFIEVEDYATTMGLLGVDRAERVIRQLEAVTQRTIEREFHDGYIARTQSLQNSYLTNTATVVVLNSGAKVPARFAVSILERGISDYSAAGEQGTIHMSRDVAAILGSQYMLTRVEDDPGHFHIETNNGTTVVIGSGYSGNGPAYAVTNKALTSISVTLTTAKPHYIEVGESVLIEGVGAPFDGTYTATTGTTGSTIVYAKTNADIASTTATGWASARSTSTLKWIYATGTIEVLLGESDVVNDNMAQAYAVGSNNNNMRFKATRPAVAYFDTSVHLAVKVDLSTSVN